VFNQPSNQKGIAFPPARPIEPPAGRGWMILVPPTILVDAEEDSASGARIFDPNDELLRYTMPVPVRGFAWAIPGDGMGEDGGEDGDGTLLESCAEVSEGVRSPKREGCCDDEGIEGTGTAARSPLSRVPA
jgi:hypothetical protein